MNSEYMQTLAQECVDEGAMWLEVNTFSWREKVDLEKLDFSSETQNILSQVTGLTLRLAIEEMDLDYSACARYGFYRHYLMSKGETQAYYTLLKKEWRAYLETDDWTSE